MKLVYVLNKNGKPLMPCKPAKARKLLRDGKAKVKTRTPFTIQLNWDCEENIQEVKIGIDKGAKYTGYCTISEGKILIAGTINHRNDVKEKMESRRNNRKARRSRKWYRPVRFLNRASSKRSGRLPVSIKTNVEEVYRVVKKLPVPIHKIYIEDVQIDVARLNNPRLKGKDYQKSNRLDENLRLACLMRDNFQCVYCKSGKVKLEAHHIIFRSEGGKDTINNLATLCNKCHNNLHDGKIKLDIKGESGFKDQMAQRTMQGKAHLYNLLENIAPIEKVFGYETAEYRKRLGLPKEHWIDALCVAILRKEEVVKNLDIKNKYIINFRPKQTRRQFHDLPRKGKGRVRYQVNKELEGFKKGDLVRVKGFEKRILSISSVGTLQFPRIHGEPANSRPNKCQLVEKSKTLMLKSSI